MAESFLSVADVCARLRVSKKTIYRAISRGELVAYMLGGEYRIDPEDLNLWLGSKRKAAVKADLRW